MWCGDRFSLWNFLYLLFKKEFAVAVRTLLFWADEYFLCEAVLSMANGLKADH